jgi:hypothetical protein
MAHSELTHSHSVLQPLTARTMSEDQLEKSCGQRRKQVDALQLGPRKRPCVPLDLQESFTNLDCNYNTGA